MVEATRTATHLTTDDLAERYCTTSGNVRYWLSQGKGPRSFKVGKRRLFALEDVLEWEAEAKARTA